MSKKDIKYHIILLAAGLSKRFNGNKLLYKINNKEMYKYIYDILIKLLDNRKDISEIIIVTKYIDIVRNISHKNVFCVINNKPQLGISSSIKIGLAMSLKLKCKKTKEFNLENINANNDAYMFCVSDQPNIKYETINNLLDNYIKTDKNIVSIEYSNNIYNPVIFSNKYLKDLLKLEGDIGGKSIVNKNKNDVYVYTIKDKKEIIDIDSRIK